MSIDENDGDPADFYEDEPVQTSEVFRVVDAATLRDDARNGAPTMTSLSGDTFEYTSSGGNDPGQISDNEAPEGLSLYQVKQRPFNPEKHRATIQMVLAFGLIAINAAAVFTLIIAVLAKGLSVGEALQLSAVMGSFQGLAGAAVGYYFAKEQNKKN
jgi:hypothetical protein